MVTDGCARDYTRNYNEDEGTVELGKLLVFGLERKLHFNSPNGLILAGAECSGAVQSYRVDAKSFKGRSTSRFLPSRRVLFQVRKTVFLACGVTDKLVLCGGGLVAMRLHSNPSIGVLKVRLFSSKERSGESGAADRHILR